MERTTGICLSAAGLLTVIGFLIHPHAFHSDVQVMWWIGHAMIFVGLIFNFLGVAWLFAMHHRALGTFGTFGFVALAIGLSHYLGKLYWSGVFYPLIVTAHPEFIASAGLGPGATPIAGLIKSVFNGGAFIFAIGFGCFGAALYRLRIYPKTPVLMMTLGAIAVGLWPLAPGMLQILSPIVSAVYAVGMIWLGVYLARAVRRSAKSIDG